MSCLEGDSLLKEIERSLEQHTKMEEQHKLEEEDDFELMLQQRNHPRSQLQEDRLKVKEFLNVSNKEVEREGKKKL